MKIPFVDLHAQYLSIKSEIDDAIQRTIRDSAYIGGAALKSFEAHFAQYLGATHCVGVGNGTDALHISLKCLGLTAGDEVIVPANSFIATSEAVTSTGARVVFVDVDERTYNIDVTRIEAAITPRTKAIVPVHLYGHPADCDGILALAKRHNLFVVEDAAQAHGARYKGKRIGTFGDCACFSFFPGKNLGAYGDAGGLVTNRADLAEKMRMYANHGRIDKYNHEMEGINSRLDGLQAAILDVKLQYLDQWSEQRRNIAKLYDEGLRGVVMTPYVHPDVEPVYHLYVVRVRNRAAVIQHLKDQGIATGIHYPIPLPFLKAYAHLGHQPQHFPVAHQLQDEIVSLPMHGSMTAEEATYVIEHVRNAVQRAASA